MDYELIEIQKEMERSAIESTKERYEKNLRDLISKGRASDSSPVLLLISRATQDLAKAVEDWIYPSEKKKGWNAGSKAKTRGVLRSLELTPFELAYCSLKIAFNSVREGNMELTFQSACFSLASAIEKENNYKRFKTEQPKLNRAIKTHAQTTGKNKRAEWESIESNMENIGIVATKLTHEERLDVGVKLLELTMSTTGLFEMKKIKRGRHNTPYILKFTDKVTEYLTSSSELFAFFSPLYRPMVCKPLRWLNIYSGGYLTGNSWYNPTLIRKMTKEHEEVLLKADLTKVLEAVNITQETPWKINLDVLEVLEEVWRLGGGRGGVPEAEELPLPVRPWGEMLPEEWKLFKADNQPLVKEWCISAQEVHATNRALTSKRHSFTVQMSIARDFSKYDKIFFPWNLDFRGRMYPIPNTLNPQGDDVSKGLIEFAIGKPLDVNGIQWFKVATANTFGNDKGTFKERRAWFNSNWEWINAIGANPMEQRGWMTADKPLQFLAFCIEYHKYLLSPRTFVSHLPVNMDGTCNGLQHLSAMLKDEVGGKAVNLTDCEEPQDIYSEVAEELKNIVELDIAEEKDTKLAEIWKDKIDRKLVKRGTMTTPYGVSQFGMREQLLMEWRHKLDGYTVDKFKACVYIANNLDKSIETTVIGARKVMNWFNLIAREYLVKTELPIQWMTPITNFPVLQGYKKIKNKRINMFIGDQRIRMRYNKEIPKKIHSARQLSGFSPNLVHSIDAAMLMETVRRLQGYGIHSFSLIHDSYGTHAADIDKLHSVLRQVFYDIYKDGKFLEELKETMLSDRDIPEQGTLDISEVLVSKYFFN